VSILLPSLNRAREQANRVKSAANLRQIGLAATIYANAAKDQEFPSSLSEIVKTQDITPQIFFSPRTGTPPPAPGLTADQAAEWVEQHSDYIWTGKGLNERAPADKILAYENPAKVKEGINILYADGHVEFKLMSAARREIEKGNKPIG
jgi:prepilin-type processing-associated H-X9-DG protein